MTIEYCNEDVIIIKSENEGYAIMRKKHFADLAKDKSTFERDITVTAIWDYENRQWIKRYMGAKIIFI